MPISFIEFVVYPPFSSMLFVIITHTLQILGNISDTVKGNNEGGLHYESDLILFHDNVKLFY